MAKIVKYLLLAMLALVVLVAVALGAVVAFVDPNEHKGEITALVQEATGRELTLAGDIELSVFPWLGLSMGEARLSNAAGFGDQAFARVEGVDIGVKILPLLQKRLEMKTVRLHGLQMHLAKNEAGVSNWEDLTAAKASPGGGPEQAGQSQAAPLAALAIGGVEMSNAQLIWDDRQAGQHLEVSKLDLTTGPVRPNTPVDVSLTMQLAMADPALSSAVDFAGQVEVDSTLQHFKLRDMSLAVTATGDHLPVSPLNVNLSADVAANLASDSLEVEALKVDTLDLTLQGRLGIKNMRDAPDIQGKLTAAEFSPRELMAALAIEVPEMADSDALTKAKLAMEFNASANALAINKLALVLDESNLTGTVALSDFQQPVIEFDVVLDELDADRYLPPASDAPPVTPGTAAAGTAQLPLDTLRGLNIAGQLKAGKFKIANARVTNIRMGLKARGGQLRLQPVQAELYGGSYQGNIGLDVRSDTPKLSLNEQLTGIAIGPLLQDVMGEDRLTGSGNVRAVLSASGITPESMKKTLNGTASIQFADGALKGINIGQLLREANAKLKNQPAPPKTVNQTDFTELTASLNIVNGLVKNDDLNAKSPLLRVHGSGTADLPREQLNYVVRASVVDTASGQAGADLEELKALTIPVKITGSFSEPKFALDLASVLDAKTKAALQEKKKALQEKAAAQIEEKREDIKQGVEEKLKDRLKNLFQ